MTDVSAEIQSPGVLVLRGEIDNYGAVSVSEWLEQQGLLQVDVVDCREVTYFGAAGLGVLLSIADGKPLPVVASPPVRRVIEICDLTDELSPIDPR